MITNPPERLTAEESQEFERYPKLAAWIEKFANNPQQSWASWCAFLGEINAALAMARASLRPLPGGEREPLLKDEEVRAVDRLREAIQTYDSLDDQTVQTAEDIRRLLRFVERLALSPPSSDWPEREADVAWLKELPTPRVRPHDRLWKNHVDRILAHLLKQKGGSAWRLVADGAPKDGTWFLLRGRNAANRPMIPVVCAWRMKDGHYAWMDAASLRDMTHLVADVPAGSSADWHPLPPSGVEET